MMGTSQFDVFLSHNSADKEAVETIARWLRQEGIEPFLDRWHLVPGEPWQEALEKALDASRTCAVFLGPAGLGTWEHEEMRVALDMRVAMPDFRVIPVLLPGAHLPERGRLPRFLARHTWVDLRAGLDDARGLYELTCGIRGIAPGAEGAVVTEAVCPFRGLQVFEEQHAPFFFGREALTQYVVEQLRQDRFLAVLGPSGSGKSSLARAGLLPQIRSGALPGSDRWPIVVLKPGTHPLEILAARLLPHLGQHADPLSARQLLQHALERDERGLHGAVQLALGELPDSVRLLLLVDQFEELFTLCRDEQARDGFIANLLYASAIAGGQTVAIVTMRADFLGKCATYPALAARLTDRDVLLEPMGEDDLRRTMLGPAEAVGLHYERGLVQTILDDLGNEPGSLPLLQHTLQELWDRRRLNWLTTDAYQEIGGVRGALAQRADAVFRQLTPAQQAAARRVLLRLTQPGEGTEDTRRRAALTELLPVGDRAADVEAAIRHLADARLLATDQDERDGEMVDVVHEALIRGWPLLQQWIDEDRTALRIHRRLTEAARDWHQNNRHEDYLFRGARLAEAEEWMQAHADDLNLIEREFLQAGVALRDRDLIEAEKRRQHELAVARQLAEEAEARRLAEAERAREAEQRAQEQSRAATRLRRLATALLVAIVGAAALAGLAWWQRNQATKQTALARSRQLAYASFGQIDANSDLTLLLAIEAGRSGQTFEADTALRDSFLHRGRTLALLTGHGGKIVQALWSADGKQIVTVSADGTARIWDAASGAQGAVLSGHQAAVTFAAWSGDAQHIVTASNDGTARVWDAATGKQQIVLSGHTDSVAYAAWSIDSRRIVTASDDYTARIWDAATGQQLFVLPGHTDWVRQAAWNSDGTRIVTASYDGTARIWDAAGKQLALLSGHTARVLEAAWSKDGMHIITASYDGTARIWDATSGRQLAVLDHTSVVWHAVWSGDGKYIVSAGDDGTARIWDTDSGAELVRLSGHTAPVLSAAWSRDGTRIVTASGDGTARVWDTASGKPLAVLAGHAAPVRFASWSSDGQRIVTASDDGTARVWGPEPGADLAILVGHAKMVRQAAWNSDGTHIVTASFDRTARVWDTATGAQLAVLSGHTDSVRHAAWSSDGKRIVTASFDGTARIWDATNGVELVRLSGHTDQVWYAAWNGDGTRIVTASADGTARIWDAASGAQLALLSGHTKIVVAAAWNNVGTRVVTASADDTARIWDAASGKPLLILSGHTGDVLNAAWSGDDTRIVTASDDGTARVWDTTTGQQLAILSGHTQRVQHAAWSGDDMRIVTASDDGTARVWNATGTSLVVLAGHRGPVMNAAWSGDGTRIITAGEDGSTRVWDAESGIELARLSGHTGSVLDAAWSRDGTRIVTAGEDGTARVYYVPMPDLLKAACQRAVRNMSEGEWRLYMVNEPYRETCPGKPVPGRDY